MNWLRNVRERRLFYIVILLLTIVLIGWRYIMSGHLDINGVLDNIISAAVISLVTLSFFWLIPRDFPDYQFVVQIDPAKANDFHMQALASTTYWWHQGHFGRWTRAVVAPALEKRAHSRIRWIIIDPRNDDICKKYVDFRNHHRLVVHDIWNVMKLKCEIYSTLFAAFQYHHSKSPISVDVYVSDHFSTFRLDLTEKAVFITTVDSRDPPIMLTQESAWYSVLKDQFEYVLKQTTKVVLEDDCVEYSDNINGEYVKKILNSMGFDVMDDVIISYVIENWNKPYYKYN